MSRPVRPQALRSADRQTALAVFLILLGIYTATLAAPFDNPDAEVEFQTTRSLALGKGLALTAETPEGAALMAVRFNLREGTDGRLYSWFGIGQAAAGVPLYWAGRLASAALPELEERHRSSEPHMGVARSEYLPRLFVAWRNPLLGAATAALLVFAARRLGATRPAAFGAALAYGAATFAWPQARSGLSDVQATFLLVLAFDAWLRARESFLRLGRPRRRDLVLFGAAAGAAGLTRIAVAPALLVLALALLATLVRGHRELRSVPLLRRRSGPRALASDLALAFVPAAAAAGLWLAANHVRFGDALESGYGAAMGTFFGYPPTLGLAGLWISPGRGLVWLAPLVVLVPLGLWRIRADRAAVLVVLGASAALFALVAPTQGWHGAWTFGPRYALPALAVLWSGVALALDGLAQARLLPWLAGPLVLLGLVANLGGVLVDHPTHQDLALRAAAIEWPEVGLEGGPAQGREADEARFLNVQWDWRFAAPWAHWRILRHRVAGLGEEFPVRRVFGVDDPALLVPNHARDRGFSHLAWVDLAERLRVGAALVLALCAASLSLGAVSAVRALDPTRP